MLELSDDEIKRSYASTSEPEAVLCAITADTYLGVLRFCDQPGGLTSNGIFYPFYPFTITFGGASIDEPVSTARLEVANLDATLLEISRTVKIKPILNVQVVRLAEPDIAEQELIGVKLDDVDSSTESLVFTLSPRDFKQEPANHARYIIARTPGLFDGVRKS